MSTTTEFLDALESWHRDLDRHIKRLPIASSQTCSSCTHASPGCCSQKNLIAFHEALPIVRLLKRNKLDTPELRARLRELGEAMEGSPRRAWFETATPCAFLVDGRCSVYSARPVSCRTYIVTSDPKNCQPGAADNAVSFADMSHVLADSIRRAREIHLALGIKETSKRILIGTLPRLVLIALEAWDCEDAAAFLRLQRWPTDEEIRGEWLEGDNDFRAAAVTPPR